MRYLMLWIVMSAAGGYLAWRLFCCQPRSAARAEIIDLTRPRKGRKGRIALDGYQRDIDRRGRPQAQYAVHRVKR